MSLRAQAKRTRPKSEKRAVGGHAKDAMKHRNTLRSEDLYMGAIEGARYERKRRWR